MSSRVPMQYKDIARLCSCAKVEQAQQAAKSKVILRIMQTSISAAFTILLSCTLFSPPVEHNLGMVCFMLSPDPIPLHLHTLLRLCLCRTRTQALAPKPRGLCRVQRHWALGI
eukprot:1157597-Pelagomonas_calceolata.AAC.6